MITEQIFKKQLNDYINDENHLNEELSNDDIREIRKMIRMEIAEVFFDLFKKRGTWV